ncbi:gamma-tubulin complex component 3 homolog [Ptychodera flava]|uniref:gamma-tubulin complex component 3 homolog n=1 Tax=Ptychodera flava TaxID=63121 RepID=UPI00396A308E
MSYGNIRDPKNPTNLLRSLVCHVTKRKEDEVGPYFQHALRVVGSQLAPSVEKDEFQIAERIKKKLVKQGRQKDAAVFSELHRKLQSQAVLKNRWAVLYLLHELSADPKKRSKASDGVAIFGSGLPVLAHSTPQGAGDQYSSSRLYGSTTLSAQSSGIGSGVSSISGPTPTPMSLLPSYAPTPGITPANQIGSRLVNSLASSRQMDLPVARTASNQGDSRVRVPGNRDDDNLSFEMSEPVLLRDVIYALQGINGRLLKQDSSGQGFTLDPNVGVMRPYRDLVRKISELGWLYMKVRKYVDDRSTDRAFGLVGQSLCAALQQELTEYYKLIAVLESQLQQEQDLGVSVNGGNSMTLRKLVVWTYDPMVRMKALASLVDACKGKKGGALATSIHSHMWTGDPVVRALVRNILKVVSHPICSILYHWIYEGELEDTYHEFFVAADPTVKKDRLWHDKYTLRKSMLPLYITLDQARKILLIGKSINFVRQVCQDRTPIRGRTITKTSDLTPEQAEMLFNQEMDSTFQEIITSVYKDTSKHLLDILFNKYKFLEHLKAMRRYLLLGQGDFIRHLMDLLEDDLSKSATVLYLHNLTGVLETAIRGTNAQFDDPEILKRLDVRLLEVSPGDCGWDVFSLDYHVDGPISTVFTQQCLLMYLREFNFLWRAKRMEYILANIWRVQMDSAKKLNTITEIVPVLHQCHVIAAEMVHFVHQMQYYITFEVLECAWDELWKTVTKAEDLDHIIAAHEVFLDTIISRSLLGDESKTLLTQLRAIFDLIIKFQHTQESFYQAALDELDCRLMVQRQIQLRTEEGEWGGSTADDREDRQRRHKFSENVVKSNRAQLKVLAQTYQDMVQNFLILLAKHSDESLQLLGVRLDFNEYYKAKEPQIRSPMTYGQSSRKTFRD